MKTQVDNYIALVDSYYTAKRADTLVDENPGRYNYIALDDSYLTAKIAETAATLVDEDPGR